MGKIFCLMGKSSSGKDTIFGRIKDEFNKQLEPVTPYTTRPMRVGEVEGREYHFISTEQLKAFEVANKVIEQRVYQTINGPWHYATIDDGQINVMKHNYIMIVTLEAYVSLVAYFGQDYVEPIYVDVEDGIRLERALNRERQQNKPNYNELCRRFLADNEDFSIANLEKANITHFYVNDELERCITEISNAISNTLMMNN